MIEIKKFVVNPVQENTFVLSDETGECVIVDPGFYDEEECAELKTYLTQNNLKPVKIINTHCHFDHIWGVEFVRNEYGVPFCAHADDAPWVEGAVERARMFGVEMNPVQPIDCFLEEGEDVVFGNSKLQVFHVPGHAQGHVVFYSKTDEFLIAGDVLFYRSIGRTDLPGGDYNTLISNIQNKLLVLPDNTKVYCGHGSETTIGFEKNHNSYLV